MPAGSGHGFVQLVSCGLRAALFYDLLSAPGAEEQDFAACGPRPGSAQARDFLAFPTGESEGNSSKTFLPWQPIESELPICANRQSVVTLSTR